MRAQATLTEAARVLPFREQQRAELDCQLVHDSLHRRPDWTMTYALELGGTVVGFASVAVDGPWKGQPTLFEFYVQPADRMRGFDLFEAMLSAASPPRMEVQSNDTMLAVMLHTYARNVVSEKIVFHDKLKTLLPANGATLRCKTPMDEIRAQIERRQGGPEWEVELGGSAVGRGGLLFHYNRPYGDIHMEIDEPFRGRGLGSWLVQELKREAYHLGAVPGARCNPGNIASRRTLQKAGFVPCAHILAGSLETGATALGQGPARQ